MTLSSYNIFIQCAGMIRRFVYLNIPYLIATILMQTSHALLFAVVPPFARYGARYFAV
jgi:hypothetical protein